MGKAFSQCVPTTNVNKDQSSMHFNDLFTRADQNEGTATQQEELILNEILNKKGHKLFILHLRYFGPKFLFALITDKQSENRDCKKSAFDLLENYFTEVEINEINCEHNTISKSKKFYGTINYNNLFEYCKKHHQSYLEKYLQSDYTKSVSSTSKSNGLPKASVKEDYVKPAFDVEKISKEATERKFQDILTTTEVDSDEEEHHELKEHSECLDLSSLINAINEVTSEVSDLNTTESSNVTEISGLENSDTPMGDI